MSRVHSHRLGGRSWWGHAGRAGEPASLNEGAGLSDAFSARHAVRPGESASLNGRRVLAVAANVPVRHTARAVTWTPLAGGVVVLLGVGVVVVAAGASTDPLLGLATAVVAAGALAGLHDPAADLLSAVPTSPARRRVHRLALLVPAVAVVWAGLLLAARLDAGWQSGWPVGPLVALLTTGIAAATWAPRGWSVPAAVTVPLALAMLDRLVSPEIAGRWLTEWVLSAWVVHPWTVVACAGAATAEGWRR